MGFAEGVVWSLLGAVAHTVIDVLRKFGAQKLPPAGAHTIPGTLACGPTACAVFPTPTRPAVLPAAGGGMPELHAFTILKLTTPINVLLLQI